LARSDHDGRSIEPVIADLTSVVIVAADSGPLLQACLDSVLVADTHVEVILVDNASSDGETTRAMARYAQDPRLHLLRNEANLGFGPACNRGAARATGDMFVFLNPDCELRSETVAGLRETLQSDARIGLLGVTVCNPDGSPARGNRRRDPGLRRALMTLTGLSRFESRWPAFAGIEMPAARSEVPIERVEAVSGACMTLPRATFEQVGGFDEAYFLHVEDLDLCRRVREAGREVAIVHSLRVTHAQGSSSRCRPLFVDRHKHRGMWRYFRRFDPAARHVVIRVIIWLGLWTHFVVRAPVLAWRTAAQRPR
jgi:N-acetylglucosaminyl-diphospho-decaprenol L-rhamnosyltransferase